MKRLIAAIHGVTAQFSLSLSRLLAFRVQSIDFAVHARKDQVVLPVLDAFFGPMFDKFVHSAFSIGSNVHVPPFGISLERLSPVTPGKFIGGLACPTGVEVTFPFLLTR